MADPEAASAASTERHRLKAALYVAIFGALMAGVVALAKPLGQIGVPALASAAVQTGGAGLLLGLGQLLGRRPPPVDRRHGQYYLIAAFLGLAVPNVVVFAASARIGAGTTALYFAVPPILTYLLAALLGFDRAETRRIVAVLIGFAGAVAVILPTASANQAPAPWLALTALAPLFLAIGNIYRSVAWPPGARPGALAAGTLIAAGLLLLPVAAATGGLGALLGRLGEAAPPLLAQIGLTALAFLVYFELQRIGGPVYLSLIGYAIAAFGALYGAVFFGETLPLAGLFGAGLIVLGILLSRPRPFRRPAAGEA